MSINIEKIPAGEVCFARNGAKYIFSATGNITLGNHAEFALEFSDFPVVDDTIVINYSTTDGAKSLNFIFKSVIDGSGLQLLASTTYLMGAYLALVRLDFLKNYNIANDWLLEIVGSTIVFSAIKHGEALLSITFPVGMYIQADIAEHGIDDVILSNYKIYVETKKGSLRLGEDLIAVDSSNNALIDVSDYVLAELNPIFSQNLSGSSKIEEAVGCIDDFFIQAAECFGEPPVINALLTNNTSNFKAMKGGIGKLREALWNVEGGDMYEMIKNGQMFLTWQPNIMVMDRRMPGSLFYLHYDSSTTLRVYVKCYYTNGATHTYECATLTGCSQYKVYELTTAPDNLFAGITLTTYVGHYIYKYDLCLQDIAHNQLTIYKTFVMDYTPYQYLRYFKYLNSFGVYDTIRTTGSYEKEKSFEFQKVARNLANDFTNLSFEKQNVNITQEETFKASTGWFNKDSEQFKQLSEAFSELFLSTMPFELSPEGIIPIVITKADHVVNIDDVNLRAIAFEYQKTYIDQLFTNVTDSGTALGNAGYFGAGYGLGYPQPPTDILEQPIGLGTN